VGIFQTGKKFSVRRVTVLNVQGNKISRETDYWDLATVTVSGIAGRATIRVASGP
jgi:ketosteroid isomerase-like protein